MPKDKIDFNNARVIGVLRTGAMSEIRVSEVPGGTSKYVDIRKFYLDADEIENVKDIKDVANGGGAWKATGKGVFLSREVFFGLMMETLVPYYEKLKKEVSK